MMNNNKKTNADWIALHTKNHARCNIRVQGAHIASWSPAGRDEQLFMSRLSSPDQSQPLRGGIPLIFPQFADLGPLPKHGFARTAIWRLEDVQQNDDTASAILVLTDTPESMQFWPHSFTATIRITLTDQALQVDWQVRNEGVQTMSFQAALHTYFRVAEGQFATILGLANSPSYNKLTQEKAAANGANQLIVKNAIDSIYAQTPDHLILQTGLGELQIDKHGFPDTVVWTPWDEGARQIADLADDEGRAFICVEAACVNVPIILSPQQNWNASMKLECSEE
ncbi:D-hexose-6-phosphate mutarotase [Undibacterium sp. CY21W]|uniref:D-hexose-6-phosphate mutarotase n=1 Tax=Undibacterium sp. CY21W TaxID=2762293 RepID=UPI00164B7C95|nr:D-hexose-6-phosphate mutarotase [Undibacterium sp. CY21W]MBC3929199.1 D-hexose-6-phosphate mutarotase [Undibacterium sp. CY21W]